MFGHVGKQSTLQRGSLPESDSLFGRAEKCKRGQCTAEYDDTRMPQSKVDRSGGNMSMDGCSGTS